MAGGDRSPPAPTDPDLRISRIRLFEQRVRYTLLAIRSNFVETCLEFEVSIIFPPHGSTTRHPLPSAGSLGQAVPASLVLRGAPTSGRPSHLAQLITSLGGTALRGGARISQVPGGPAAYVPCSQTPAGRTRLTSEDDVRCGE